MKRLSLVLSITMLGVIGAAAPASAALPKCNTGDVNGDLVVDFSCLVPKGTTIVGNFKGKGGLHVIGGRVKGNVIGRGADLSIAGHVDGRVVQRNNGSVTLWNGARVDGKVIERGVGDARARDGASVGGNFVELGWGMLKITDATIEGNVSSDTEPPHPVPEPGKSFCQILYDQGAVVLGELKGSCVPGFYDV